MNSKLHDGGQDASPPSDRSPGPAAVDASQAPSAVDEIATDLDFDKAYSFGPFVLQPNRRILRQGDTPVEIGSRALDILCLLVEAAGELVSRDEILAHAWPKMHVTDVNVRVQIAEVRRALGDGHNGRRYIVSVPNRGYCFVEPIHGGADPPDPECLHPVGRPLTRLLPTLHSKIIGREEAAEALLEQVLLRRLVTVIGTGGVGKTTFVVAMLSQLLDRPEPIKWRMVCFVDLSSAADERVVASAFASALGVTMVNDDAISSLVQQMRDEACLIVVDGCEHVIGIVADIVEAMLREAPRVHIVATSREPLRVEGEWIFRLDPLVMPPNAVGLTLETAIRYPAIELFIARAEARSGTVAIGDEDIRWVVEICRRLDGIPLALEFAAGRIEALGTRGLATALDNQFAILTEGRRTALPQHRTLYATLEWSFNLLGPREQALLVRLAIFPSKFTLNCALAIAAWGDLGPTDVVEGISDLVARSLISVDVSREQAVFRLLETTRAYARQKLVTAPDASEVAKHHAAHCVERLADADKWGAEDATDLPGRYGLLLDDLRAALKWAFSSAGSVDCGISLVVAAVPLWLRLSLVNECHQWVEHALEHRGETSLSADSAMKLHTARGWSMMYTAGMSGEMSAAWTLAQDIAERLGDNEYRLRSLWGLWAAQMKSADFVAASEAAKRFRKIADKSPDVDDRAIGDRMLGTSLHFLGDQSGSRLQLERVLANYKPPSHRMHIVRYQVAPHIAGMMTLSRVLWVQGYPDQAAQAADASLEEARSLDHTLSLCYSLAQSACPIALLNGDLEQAASFIDTLLEETERHRLDVWHIYAKAYRGQLILLQGDVDGGLPLIKSAVDDLRKARFMQHHSAFLVALADALVVAGHLDAADTTISQALDWSECNSDGWIRPEMLRLKGEIALSSHQQAQGERYLDKSLDLSRKQMARGWELRAATSLSRSLRNSSRHDEARQLLAATLGQFSEGFDTADQRRARQLLHELS